MEKIEDLEPYEYSSDEIRDMHAQSPFDSLVPSSGGVKLESPYAVQNWTHSSLFDNLTLVGEPPVILMFFKMEPLPEYTFAFMPEVKEADFVESVIADFK